VETEWLCLSLVTQLTLKICELPRSDEAGCNLLYTVTLLYKCIVMQVYLEYHLKPTWDWLIGVMDATEAQLRFGSVLSNVTNPAHPSHPLHASYVRGLRTATAAEQLGRTEQHSLTSAVVADSSRRRTARMNAGTTTAASTVDGHSARRDFLSYALSLMRSHNDEHADNLPTLDITSLKHVAYVLDALIYYMRSGGGSDVDSMHDAANDAASVQSWQDPDDNLNDETDEDAVNQSETVETDSLDGESDVGTGLRSGRRHPFFQRSDSTIFLGCNPPDPFQVPLVEALPLADQPHLLHPYARKEELFGMPRQTVSTQSLVSLDVSSAVAPRTPQSQSQWPFDHLPTHMALSCRSTGAGSVMIGGRVAPPTAVGDLVGVMPAQPPPAHVASSAEAASSLAAESSVIVQPQTSSVVQPRPTTSASPEPAYLGVASAPVKHSLTADSTEPMLVESIPLPLAYLDRPVVSPVACSAYSVTTELSSQPTYVAAYQQAPYLAPLQQPSVIVHPSTSSSHVAAYHREPLELSMSSRSAQSGESSHLRSPPAYDDLHASNNVCLDLTNPYRSAAVEIPSTVSAARTSSSEATS